MSKMGWQTKLYVLFFILLLLPACDSLAAPLSWESEPTTSGQEASVDQPIRDDQLQSPLPPPYTKGDIRFEHISSEDGLSQNAAFSIIQDSQGFMWFGTQDGLNKYDGYSFTIYKHDPQNPTSISGNWINDIYEDSTGTIWVGTLSGGLNRYDSETEQFFSYLHDPEDPSSLSDNDVKAISEDQAGILWIGTGGGLDSFDTKSGVFTHYRHHPDDFNSISSNSIVAVVEDQEGILWIGTEGGGLNRLNRETGEFTRYLNDPDDPYSLSHNTVWTIYDDHLGEFWVGTNDGLNRLDRTSGKFTRFQNDPEDPNSLSHNRIRAIYEDQAGVLWIGTDGGGLDRFDRETGHFIDYQNDPGDPYSLSHFAIYEIYQDREGVLWIGANGGPLNKVFLEGLNFSYFKHDSNDDNSLSNNDVRGILEDRVGDLWVATSDGLNRFDQETGQWRLYHSDPDDPLGLSSDLVTDIYEDQQGLLWIGTLDNGLNILDPATDQFSHYQTDSDDPASLSGLAVSDIYQDQDGMIWVGTLEAGLNRYEPESDNFTRFQRDPDDLNSISSNAIVTIAEDSEGFLWIGTLGSGLDKFDRESKAFTHFQADPEGPDSLSNNLIPFIYEDNQGDLWIGTAGGLNKFDRTTETFSHYREKDGLPNDLVYGLLADDQGDFWLSTNKGLSRFNPQTAAFKNFDVSDGLQGDEFNALALHQGAGGQMFFGGVNGLNAFYPGEVKDNLTVPPLIVTALTQGGAPLDSENAVNNISAITLNWPGNFFEFEFAALSYANPEENEYAYMLEGFDEDWNRVGNRRYGRYTNLPAGTYTLRLIGSNNDGVWNEEGVSLKVTVVPPFWATWWFRGLGILALLGMVIGGYRLRVRNVEERSHELESQVISRTKELAALNDVAGVVSRSLDLQRILTNALEKTLEIMEIEAGGIYLLQEDDALTLVVHQGFDAQFVTEVDHLQVGEGFSGRVVMSGEPLIVPDLTVDSRLTRSVVKESDFHSLAVVPLVSRAKVLGTLTVASRGHREFSEQDIALLTSIGDQIGVAVENAQLHEQAQQAAVVQERQRLARELHDSISQSLHSLILLAEAGQRLAGAGDLERSRGYLVRLGEISQQAMKEMRLLVYELRPLALREAGLLKALQQRLDTVERRAGVEAKLQVEGEVEIPDDVEEALFRVAQEALNNALKHAAPTTVIVTIRFEEDPAKRRIVLEVADNGMGFDPDSMGDKGGIGLESMRERLEKLGGVLTIVSRPGEGTRVIASVPTTAAAGPQNSEEVIP